jgi:hypothetical protein
MHRRLVLLARAALPLLHSVRPAKLTGFVYFADIPGAVAENASKKRIEGRWPMLNSRTGKSRTYWRRLGNWRDDIERFEHCLARARTLVASVFPDTQLYAGSVTVPGWTFRPGLFTLRRTGRVRPSG